jgi:hypothetical protein
VESQKEGILGTYFAVAQKYQKPYCYPSQVHTVRLLAKYSKIKISVRTLNRRLRELEDAGYIKRTKRHREGKDGKIIFNTTLTHLKARAFDWASRGLMKSARVFSFFRLPKMALYRFKTARYSSIGDNLAGLITQFLSKGEPSAVFRTA